MLSMTCRGGADSGRETLHLVGDGAVDDGGQDSSGRFFDVIKFVG